MATSSSSTHYYPEPNAAELSLSTALKEFTIHGEVPTVNPPRGEVGQFVYARGSHLLSTTECWLKWYDLEGKRERSGKVINPVKFRVEEKEKKKGEEEQIGFVIPKRCCGHVTILFLDRLHQHLDTQCYSVITVTGIPHIEHFRFLRERRWVFIEGVNFRLGSTVLLSQQ